MDWITNAIISTLDFYVASKKSDLKDKRELDTHAVNNRYLIKVKDEKNNEQGSGKSK